MIYDHGSHIYANGWVGYPVWLKERNLSLDLSKAKWPVEEETEEEERLAKMLAEAKSTMGKGSWEEYEGATDREVETIELDADTVVDGDGMN
ncbi:hypothetical protein O6P43_020445 [Quillaja saponaria]|uniref:Uncharacterized protein n=1 Tax=Quillaja saponaria TaxID=32244 RepID=A0AAD7LL34_QUISA|nr:hypothetical protein O6P43_020445 [Quillaja saponaria]